MPNTASFLWMPVVPDRALGVDPATREMTLRNFFYNPKFVRPEDGRTDDFELKSERSDFTPPATVLKFPEYRPAKESWSESFYAAQEWDGFVTQVCEDSFLAMLTDVGGREETEKLEFSLDAVQEGDRAKVCVGAMIRVCAGYSRKRTGQIRHAMTLYFRPSIFMNDTPTDRTDKIKRFFSSGSVAPQPIRMALKPVDISTASSTQPDASAAEG